MTGEQFDEILHALLDRRPFRPFTVELPDGKRIKIELPGSTATRDGFAVYLSRDTRPVDFGHENIKQVVDDPVSSSPDRDT